MKFIKKIWDKLTLASKIVFIIWTIGSITMINDDFGGNLGDWFGTWIIGSLIACAISQKISSPKRNTIKHRRSDYNTSCKITPVSGYSAICGVKKANKTTFRTLQSLSAPDIKRGALTTEQILYSCDLFISGNLRIIDDCKELISKTENPDVFYGRYELLIEKYYELLEFQPYIEIYGYQPYESLAYYTTNRTRFEKKFVDRCYNKALIKADSLKTEKAKTNQFIKAYENLSNYSTTMSAEAFDYLNKKFNSKLSSIQQ